MATTNAKPPKRAKAKHLAWLNPPVQTHNAGPGVLESSPVNALRRATLATMLFEDTFYEAGSTLAARLAALVKACKPAEVVSVAIEARNQMYLRHVPLFLTRELARTKGNGKHVYRALMQVIQRPDEIAEFVSMYWGPKHTRGVKHPAPLSAAIKRALADSFGKFKEETLAKYRDDDKNVSMRDVYRLVWASGTTKARHEVYRKLLDKELKSSGTWESELSAGADKKAVFESLLKEERLGGLAVLRNLRNMQEAKVDRRLIVKALREHPFTRVLPFRFIAAAKHAPDLVSELSDAMERVSGEGPKLPGRTIVLVDVSGSMDGRLSAKSDMDRIDAAAGVAIIARARGEDVAVFTFSSSLVEVPAYRGLALQKAIQDSQPHNSTYLGRAIATLNRQPYDRLIVFTDEQSDDAVPAPREDGQGYMVNVASYNVSVAEDRDWVKINGFSERIVDYIGASEGLFDEQE